MKGTDALRSALTSTQYVLTMYLGDLTDADLLVRPVPSANHIAWQLGHLVLAERHLLGDQLPGVKYADLPAGFAEQHTKDTAGKDPPTGFLGKAAYLALLEASRQATIAAVSALSDADLDRPSTGPMATFAPTLGDMVVLASNHTMMHAGQFSAVRRKLGKPVLF